MQRGIGWNLSILRNDRARPMRVLSDVSISKIKIKLCQRNWVLDTNSIFVIPISIQPNGVNLWYFKLRLFELTDFIVWNL